MKQKTEAQKQKIMDAAHGLFLEKGPANVSMSDIAAAMGGSKATIYNYFKNKDEVFAEVMLASIHKIKGEAFQAVDCSQPLPAFLKMFGNMYLKFTLSPKMMDVRRTVVAHIGVDDTGRIMYERGLKPAWMRIAGRMEDAMKSGEMKKGNPWHAATQFKALLEADLLDQNLMGVKKRTTQKEIEDAVNRALDLFGCYYFD